MLFQIQLDRLYVPIIMEAGSTGKSMDQEMVICDLRYL